MRRFTRWAGVLLGLCLLPLWCGVSCAAAEIQSISLKTSPAYFSDEGFETRLLYIDSDLVIRLDTYQNSVDLSDIAYENGKPVGAIPAEEREARLTQEEFDALCKNIARAGLLGMNELKPNPGIDDGRYVAVRILLENGDSHELRGHNPVSKKFNEIDDELWGLARAYGLWP